MARQGPFTRIQAPQLLVKVPHLVLRVESVLGQVEQAVHRPGGAVENLAASPSGELVAIAVRGRGEEVHHGSPRLAANVAHGVCHRWGKLFDVVEGRADLVELSNVGAEGGAVGTAIRMMRQWACSGGGPAMTTEHS